jgi:CheY-like chemotaxis protein
MTNQAISAILDNLCNEARNFAHSSFGVMELLRDAIGDPAQESSIAIGAASADRLLRSIDDVRDLLASNPPPAGALLEEFDVAMHAGEIAEVLSLASRDRRKRFIIDAPAEPLPLTQDRRAVEQILTRVLDTALKLATPGDPLRLQLSRTETGAQIAIVARDAGLAAQLAHWLNLSMEETDLPDPEDVSFGIAVMVAGKRLRALGGSAGLAGESAGRSCVALHFPSEARALCQEVSVARQADCLNILVAEDCDDSFFLTDSMLARERVWRAQDGHEALAMIQRQRFDVVFMDVHMPGLDGYGVIRHMRDWETLTGNARTPMVILSSDDLDTQRRQAAQSGCSGFLRKPLRSIDLADLLGRLRQARLVAA